MGEFGMRWRNSVCLYFNTQRTVIDMVWLSHGLDKTQVAQVQAVSADHLA